MIRAATLRYGGQRRNRLSKISAQAWRWSEVAPFARGEPATSRLDDRHHLAFGNDVVDRDENGFQCAGGRRRDRNLHLHGFDEGEVVAVANARSGFERKGAHAPGDFGHYSDIWHTKRLLVVAADCLR